MSGVYWTQTMPQYAERPTAGNGRAPEFETDGSGARSDKRGLANPFVAKVSGTVKPEVCAMTRLYKLAASLARPVSRGWLSIDDAEDSLAVATVRAKLGPYEPDFVFGMARWTLQQRLKSEETRRELAAGRIRSVLHRMIDQRKPSRALLAESHGVNGDANFPLTEDEVTEVAHTEMWWALQRGGRRHG